MLTSASLVGEPYWQAIDSLPRGLFHGIPGINMDRNNRQTREEGIRVAKDSGRYTGRKPIEINENLLKQVAYEFQNNHIIEQEAMRRLGVNSRSTFYRKLRTIRN